jgi:hypothetical protein
MALMRYAKFYKFVYELPPGDRPSDAIIESDADVDRWYEAFVRQTERAFLKHKKGGPPNQRREGGRNQIPTFEG